MNPVSVIKKSFFLVIICLITQLILVGVCSAKNSSSNVPYVMSYEGYITDPNDIPLPDGKYDFAFALYTDPRDGSPIWEERHKNVNVKNGFVQLYLGRGTPSNPLDIPFDQQYFLGIRVGSEPEMVPRLELATAPYSFRARIADEVADVSITTGKLAPLSVTDENIVSVSWGKIIGVPELLSTGGGPKGGVPANVWSLFGNRKSDSTKDFLGTTDLQALVFRTNNLERLRIRDTGEIDIGSDLNIGNDVTIGHDLDVGNNARIGHDLRVDNNLDVIGLTHLWNVTDSVSTAIGALVVDGGVGIAKRLNVGGAGLFESTLTVMGATLLQSSLDVNGIIHLLNDTDSTYVGDGALIVDGGVGIAKRLNVGGDGLLGGKLTVEGDFLLKSKLDVNGPTHLQDDTQSDNTTTGALVVDGGVGIAKRLNVGGDGLFESMLTVMGDSLLQSKLDVLGQTHLQDVTESTSTTSGALIVDGGVGIDEDLNVGGNLNVGGSLSSERLRVDGSLYVTTQGSLAPPGTNGAKHVAYFENTGQGSWESGIAIKIARETWSANNFVTFYNNNGIAGRIEGFDKDSDAFDVPALYDTVNHMKSIFPQFLDFDAGKLPKVQYTWDWALLTDEGAWPLAVWLEGGKLPSLSFNVEQISELPESLKDLYCWGLGIGLDGLITVDPLSIALTAMALETLPECLDGGVTYGSKGADYAEWLPKLDPEEKIYFGQIVGVHGGKISKKTTGAEQIMAVSTAPVVVGNMPPAGEESGYAKVAFMGQVPVLVRGEVKVGDFIITSGRNDGIGAAVSPDDLKPQHLRQILGKAWSESTNDRLSMINVLVSVRPSELVQMLEQQQERVDMLESRVERLESLLGGLAADQESSVKMIGASK